LALTRTVRRGRVVGGLRDDRDVAVIENALREREAVRVCKEQAIFGEGVESTVKMKVRRSVETNGEKEMCRCLVVLYGTRAHFADGSK
jgi:hypothetical protein